VYLVYESSYDGNRGLTGTLIYVQEIQRFIA